MFSMIRFIAFNKIISSFTLNCFEIALTINIDIYIKCKYAE